MEEATESTVLGDFDGATFEQAGVVSTFSRREGRYFVRTDGPDGALHDYEIAYTFGVDPLQQYLVAFPGGRYQALGIAWDSRPREQGGQRWFHLYPEHPPAAGDPLHWTGIDQTWNHMCAECHSTNLRKGYRADGDRYETTWSEIDVACESCHGPGSEHVAWARDAGSKDRRDARTGGSAETTGESLGLVVRLHDRALDGWEMNPETGTVRRTAPPPSRLELETCARCHSRRGLLDERYVNGRPLLDTHRPALLDQGLYFADGQIRDEVYEYGSFLQSKMHAAGVTCSDCHDPHSLELLAPGDALCARCHAPERFAVETHHHHAADSAGARCVECHMPERTYMVIDRRRDHSLRLPRPDLEPVTGAPDACTACHRDRDAAWAARVIAGWGGGPRPPHWGEVVAAAWRGEPGVDSRLARAAQGDTFPPIARATMLSLLRDAAAPDHRAALEHGIADANGLVRLGALRALEGAGAEERVALVPPLLHDPMLAVRTEAARLLAEAPSSAFEAGDLAARDAALAEYRASQEVDADRPEAHLNLGNLALAQGDLADRGARVPRSDSRRSHVLARARQSRRRAARHRTRSGGGQGVAGRAGPSSERRDSASCAGPHAGAARAEPGGAGRARARRDRRAGRAALRVRPRGGAALDGEDRRSGGVARAHAPQSPSRRRRPGGAGLDRARARARARPRWLMHASSRRSIPTTRQRARW